MLKLQLSEEGAKSVCVCVCVGGGWLATWLSALFNRPHLLTVQAAAIWADNVGKPFNPLHAEDSLDSQNLCHP